ncbi:dihydroneopterin aldolase [Marinicella sp. W31]|uniref:dihydroneopterin aldolase n=1 Tax=Marinicella sp. W31 TaxID=3023713 RepID=UPI0037578F85
MDQILIEQLTAQAIIGIHDWERKNKQPVVLDITLEHSIAAAAQSDAIEDALDYQQLCELLTEHIETSSYHLIETLADSCAQLIFRHFSVDCIDLKLRKPEAIENTSTVGVRIVRTAAQYAS